MVRWSLWWARQREQSSPLVQSKYYILQSPLWESTWNLQRTKNCSLSRGFSHGGHQLSSSSGPPDPFNTSISKSYHYRNHIKTHYHHAPLSQPERFPNYSHPFATYVYPHIISGTRYSYDSKTADRSNSFKVIFYSRRKKAPWRLTKFESAMDSLIWVATISLEKFQRA